MAELRFAEGNDGIFELLSNVSFKLYTLELHMGITSLYFNSILEWFQTIVQTNLS